MSETGLLILGRTGKNDNKIPETLLLNVVFFRI